MATIDILGVQHTYDLTPPSANLSSPTLVFIHGWLLSRSYWQPLLEKLAPFHQCLVYDLRGFGESECHSYINPTQHPHHHLLPKETHTLNHLPRAEQRYTLANYAQDLYILLQELNINNAWLIGHSLGGSIALWGAKYCPDRVKGVICLNSGGGIYLKEEFERFRTAGKQIVKLRPRWLSHVPGIDLLFTRAMVDRPLSQRWGKQRVIDFVRADPQAALGTLLDSTTESEVSMLPQVVAQLKQPIYFLAGSKDKVMEPKYVRHLASFHTLFKNCADNVIDIPNCGHLSMLEQPNLVVSHILNILKTYQQSNQ